MPGLRKRDDIDVDGALTMTPTKLKSAREIAEDIIQLSDKATPGPWFPCGCRYTMISRELNENEIEDIAEVCNHFRDEYVIEMNKQLIAYFRSMAPDLARAYLELEKSYLLVDDLHSKNFMDKNALKVEQMDLKSEITKLKEELERLKNNSQ